MVYKCLLLVLFSFGILETQSTPVPWKKLSKAELNEIALSCIDEVNIDKSVIDLVLSTGILPQNDQKYKKYLECSYKKQGYLSSDGKMMIYSNLFAFLQQFYDVTDLEAELSNCKLIKQDDAGELCFQNLECILNGLHRIEAKNSDNDFESNYI